MRSGWTRTLSTYRLVAVVLPEPFVPRTNSDYPIASATSRACPVGSRMTRVGVFLRSESVPNVCRSRSGSRFFKGFVSSARASCPIETAPAWRSLRACSLYQTSYTEGVLAANIVRLCHSQRPTRLLVNPSRNTYFRNRFRCCQKSLAQKIRQGILKANSLDKNLSH